MYSERAAKTNLFILSTKVVLLWYSDPIQKYVIYLKQKPSLTLVTCFFACGSKPMWNLECKYYEKY